MNCSHIKRKLSAYIDGEITQAMRGFVEAHLEACDSCREAFLELEASWDILNTLPDADPSAHAYTRVKARMASQDAVTRPGWLERLLVPAATAAAFVIGIWVGSFVGKNGSYASEAAAADSASAIYLDVLDDFPAASLSGAYITLAVED